MTQLNLPEPFSGQDIRNCTTVEDQEYMRGYNRALDEVIELNPEVAATDKRGSEA
jgi:hypothetical protein